MTKFTTEEEAIRLANDSPYGLTHYAHTYDKERRRRLAQKLQSGMIVMNQVGLASSSPFGGVKQSGNSREGKTVSLKTYVTGFGGNGLTDKKAPSIEITLVIFHFWAFALSS